MDNIKMEIRKLSFEFVYDTLKNMSSLFVPPLSESLDIESYAKKLSDKAQFIVCMNEDKMIGFTAFYLNSIAQQIYIPLICVDEKYQTHGVGSKMLDFLYFYSEGLVANYNTIGLEVNKKNSKAYRFYLKQEFEEHEDRGCKLLMVKQI